MQHIRAQEVDNRVVTATVDELYLRYRYPLLGYLTNLVHDYDLAEDLCQETFARLVQHWSTRDPHKNLVAWMYRIATNAAYDELRRSRRSEIGDSALLLVESDARLEARVEDDLIIRAALAQLSRLELQVLILRVYEDRKLSEIATLASCSVSAAKSRLVRARDRFRRVYDVQPA
jgi:RNA polymerase sigma-70 factor (ECF subfamily)